ncbi:hypothetical protein [Methylosinus sp. Sm6]|uniref:hypothetical protein n=1 Tax=Methylosinus sp. Sm6 TaxID=2866948 RepID=UPI001C998718|nr:hypothetical protein [Methylosinus sp. Sm6]MBY6244106.1 hypothetical protein [Methylosinus sp. Sm6]
MSETRTYITTDRAGFTVAARRIPGELRPDLDADGRPQFGDDGKPQMTYRPKQGHELTLSDAEAEYELAQRTIVPKPEAPPIEAKKSRGRAESDAPPSNAV